MSAPRATIAVRDLVDRVRRRVRAGEAAAGAAAQGAGTCAATIACRVASGGAGVLAALAGAWGAAAALAGAWMVARAALRPPSPATVAAWIERALPELRDSLATAVEAGPLAEVSAAYAAERIVDARVGALIPARTRRARAGVLLGAAAAVLAGSLAAALAPRTGATGAPGGVRPESPDAAEEAEALAGESMSPTPHGAAVPEAPADGEGGMTLRVVAAPARGGSPAPPPVDTAGILVTAPVGFERAVELFVSGAPGDGDPVGGGDAEPDRGR